MSASINFVHLHAINQTSLNVISLIVNPSALNFVPANGFKLNRRYSPLSNFNGIRIDLAREWIIH